MVRLQSLLLLICLFLIPFADSYHNFKTSLLSLSTQQKQLQQQLQHQVCYALKSKKTTTVSTTAGTAGVINSDDDTIEAVTKAKKKTSSKADIKRKTLVIVESPAKARTIQKFVDQDKYIIDFCAGHVRDLPSAANGKENHKDLLQPYKKCIVLNELKLSVAQLGVYIDPNHNQQQQQLQIENFTPIYIPLKGKDEIIRRLTKSAKDCDCILLATDEDREGEAISWHLAEVLQPKVQYKRAVFHEITKSAILDSFANPRDIDMNLVHSQETRRIVDRLTGYTISPVLWRYIAPGLSAGRVQSCALYLITEREKKRWLFVEAKYHSIEAAFIVKPSVHQKNSRSSGNDLTINSHMYSLDGHRIASEKDFDSATGKLKAISNAKRQLLLLDEEKTKSVINWLTLESSKITFHVKDVESKQISRRPPAPFITSTLQQESSRKLGLSPSMTMSIAQELYEEGHITYMRTDSPSLSSSAVATAKAQVSKLFGPEYLDDAASPGGGSAKAAPKNAQEAHEAIRPSDSNGKYRSADEIGLTDNKKRLYNLIYKRTLASIMKASQSLSKTMIIEASSIDGSDSSGYREAVFRSSYTEVTFKGFLLCYESDDFDSAQANDMKQRVEGEKYSVTEGTQLWIGANIASSASASSSDVDDGNTTVEEDLDVENDTTSMQSKGVLGISHSTRPPSRFTESSFIKELEDIGVGRPSTYSKIFSILKDRGYIIVDRQTLIPTLTGMVVSSFLEKHFPDLVETHFTATMEDSLDAIACGSKDKKEFLSEFYLHYPANDRPGLLHRVAQKLSNQEIDHVESRTLPMPFLNDLGVLHIVKSGAYIESAIDSNTTTGTTGTTTTSTDANTDDKNRRWKLPDVMNVDIRKITSDSIRHIIQTQTSMFGASLGKEQSSNAELSIKAGRFGKYLQATDADGNSRTYSLPQWIDPMNTSIEDAHLYTKLPMVVGVHPAINSTVSLEVALKSLCVVMKDFSLKVPFPDNTSISDVDFDLCMALLPDTQSILDSQKILGMWNDDLIVLRQGKFGYFVRHGVLIAGLGKSIDHNTISFDEAVALLETKGRKPFEKKGVGASKSKSAAAAKKKSAVKGGKDSADVVASDKKAVAKKKSVTLEVSSSVKKLTGYQVFIKATMASVQGTSLKEVASKWKLLSGEEKDLYKAQAIAASL